MAMTKHRRDNLAETGPSLTGDMLAISEAELSNHNRRKPKSSPIPMIVGVGLAVLIAGGLGLFFMMRSPEPLETAKVAEAATKTDVEATKAEPTKVEPAKVEPKTAKVEPKKAEIKAEPKKAEPKKVAKRVTQRRKRRDPRSEKAMDAALEKLNLPD